MPAFNEAKDQNNIANIYQQQQYPECANEILNKTTIVQIPMLSWWLADIMYSAVGTVTLSMVNQVLRKGKEQLHC